MAKEAAAAEGQPDVVHPFEGFGEACPGAFSLPRSSIDQVRISLVIAYSPLARPGEFNLRLNWQRVGIVASVVWAIVGVFLAERILYSLTYGRFVHAHTPSQISLPVCKISMRTWPTPKFGDGVCMLSSRSPRSLSRGWLSMGLTIIVRWKRRPTARRSNLLTTLFLTTLLPFFVYPPGAAILIGT